ncbi:deoxycytidylate deaminase [Nocardia sp. NPDC127526]|uniref:deoxycytidylate deaminase n=1 Tax=Nocardia sp. NPDC127526 TaxID=3345393 RepID=UPI003638E9F0
MLIEKKPTALRHRVNAALEITTLGIQQMLGLTDPIVVDLEAILETFDWGAPEPFDGRPDWDTYFLEIARTVAIRSTCVRAKVGAVVATDNRLRGAGYNESPPGKPGCESCPRRESGCAPGSSYDTGPGTCHAVHAEANALLDANRFDLIGATLYITREPCPGCLKLIEAAGIARIVHP